MNVRAIPKLSHMKERKPPKKIKENQPQSRPALRMCNDRGHRGGDGKPASPKTVHFHSQLEQVCYFSKSDKPANIWKTASSAYEIATVHEHLGSSHIIKQPRWEAVALNFPENDTTRKSMPVRVERLYFSGRHLALFGFVVVANLAFEKSIMCRFTWDYWKTILETPAYYYRAVKTRDGQEYDKFVFGIAMSNLDELSLSPLFFCVRYAVNGQEYWDNNSEINFTVDFRRNFD
ncbi:Protein phosphatase 1 regulatory subunit 3B [Fusarium oxysporum f. sp. rapae]|uniref:Protein phosphatase 1 regulatory subunit 3B n=1 Tax=Fusarium oxysporum f. sp. rapae TaxID=485398 RepID=A0A8J5NT92_FUSOX|nr:Protein phosphatase 1 regulatory subunit 3B [Fusarium oxysporum f. sp. rapae]